MMNMTEQEFRNMVFDSNTRVFGDVGEEMIRRLYNLQKSCTDAYDAMDQSGRVRIEIKTSRVLKKITKNGNLIRRLLENTTENRLISSQDAAGADFDCNIQQVKPAEFDWLCYALFSRTASQSSACSVLQFRECQGIPAGSTGEIREKGSSTSMAAILPGTDNIFCGACPIKICTIS